MDAVIITEAKAQPSNFKDLQGNPQFQDVCKVNFTGLGEFNVNLNKPTVDALVEAFGEDSTQWLNQHLVVEVEKTRVAGKAGISLFLIPDGFQKVDNAQGFAEIIRKPLLEAAAT